MGKRFVNEVQCGTIEKTVYVWLAEEKINGGRGGEMTAFFKYLKSCHAEEHGAGLTLGAPADRT